jgi:MYXO-CTERM domain-containing protein
MNPAFFRLSIAAAGLAALPLAALPSPAHAARPTGLVDDGRGVLVDGRLMSARDEAPTWGIDATRPSAHAWRRWRDAMGASWASWDHRTDVPRRILLEGVAAPGVIASAKAAERFARDVLADHLDLLAPGATAADFALVTNEVSDGIRTVGWQQRHAGREVVGGQVSLRFKHDRLIAVGSEAWPHVTVTAPATTLRSATAVRGDAEAWLSVDVPGRAVADVVAGPLLLPVPTMAGGIDYREVLEINVEVAAPRSRWSVYVDAQTGSPIARRQTLHHAVGTLNYDVPVRGPLGARVDRAAPFTEVLVDGSPALTDAQGAITFFGVSASVTTGLIGPLARIVNAPGEPASALVDVPDGGIGTWSAPDDEMVDAQIAAWVHTHTVKEYVRAIDPDLGWLDGQIQVTVNRNDDECNANSDGDSINFFLGNEVCENTGRLADVVYHEFGHSVHSQSVIPGVGSFDVSLSEGISDYLSATITDDSGLARGFFYDDEPLRELDPPGFEHKWPDDIGEVHYSGLIIGGALWDLRKALIAKHGAALGVQLTDRIYYESTRRAVDIPSMYAEALVVDDDDGNLANGTPNGCEINAAYGPHGLFSAGPDGEQILVDGDQVDVLVTLPSFPGCPVEATATLEVKQRGESDASAQVTAMSPTAGGFTATLPPGLEGQVLNYRVRLTYSNGAQRQYPDNLADPWYERFVGEVVPIYCTSFEDGATDWTLPPANSGFEVGPPPATSSVDPTLPAGDDAFVLGTVLGGTGDYLPGSFVVATSPVIAIPPGFASVRVQYQRWLSVEDGFFDRARIDADDEPVWENYASEIDNQAVIHHRDREWRFHDVDVSEQADDGQLQLAYSLASDQGLQFGGWTIDELCVVGVGEAAVGCGNGRLEPGEDCDDGNLAAGDGCDETCALETAGEDDGVSPGDDGSGASDDGDADGSGDAGDGELADDGHLIDRGCACSSDRTNRPPGAWLLLVLLGLRRRRDDA